MKSKMTIINNFCVENFAHHQALMEKALVLLILIFSSRIRKSPQSAVITDFYQNKLLILER